jgi:hypothetical protein
MRLLQRLLILGLTLEAGIASLWAQPANVAVGTWKVNVSKSTYLGGPAPTSRIVTVQAAAKGEKWTIDAIFPDGTRRLLEYTVNYDGKDYPLAGDQMADTVSHHRIDPYTFERVDKKGGEPVRRIRCAVSQDGKTMYTATTPSGRDSWVILEVLEKQ